METEIGYPNNCRSNTYRNMGKGSDLTKIISKLMGKFVNEDSERRSTDQQQQQQGKSGNANGKREITQKENSIVIPLDNSTLNNATAPHSANDNMHREDSKSKFECTICNKQFSSCYSQQRHMRGVHEGSKPHVCPIENCQKRFTQQSHLKKHFQTHIEEIVVTPLIFPAVATLEEDPDSIKSLNSHDSTNEIEDEDDDQKQYWECDNCYKGFFLRNNYKSHRRICHLIRNKSNMENHINQNPTIINKRKRVRLHQTFFARRRLRKWRLAMRRKSSQFTCLVRGCFSNCSSYRMYMEHVCIHSSKFRQSKSRLKNKMKAEDDGVSMAVDVEEEPLANVDTSIENNMDTSIANEDFVPLSGLGFDGLFNYGIQEAQESYNFNSSQEIVTTTLVPWLSDSPTETLQTDYGGSSFPLESVPTFTCDVCKKMFNRKFSFDRHILIHQNHRPYTCQVCGYQFTQASHLKKHERKHENENTSTPSQNSKTTSITPTSPATTETTTNTVTTTTTTTTTTANCKVPSPPTKSNSTSKLKMNIPILRIPKPIRVSTRQLDNDQQNILQPNENINVKKGSAGKRRSSKRRK